MVLPSLEIGRESPKFRGEAGNKGKMRDNGTSLFTGYGKKKVEF
jgi:hypothetical protein